MKKAKRFDCVKMKNDIQARLRRKYRGMTDDQRQATMEQELTTSPSPVAQLWRDLAARSKVAKVAETRAHYGARRKSNRG
jgi:hypothetical protein